MEGLHSPLVYGNFGILLLPPFSEQSRYIAEFGASLWHMAATQRD